MHIFDMALPRLLVLLWHAWAIQMEGRSSNGGIYFFETKLEEIMLRDKCANYR